MSMKRLNTKFQEFLRVQVDVDGFPPVASHLLSNIWFNIAMLFAIIFAVAGSPVPHSNELLYLLRLERQWNTDFLLNDWTFSLPFYEHWLFNVIFGIFTLIFPVEVLGWLGRISCWLLISAGVYRIGSHFRIPMWLITFSMILWLSIGQSVVAGSWMFGGFEAKCVAYICLLFSIDAFLLQRNTRASLLMGLSFAFHPGVGLWAVLAAGFTLIMQKMPTRELLRCGVLMGVIALPGIVPVLMMLSSSHVPADEWRYLALIKSPVHFDPFSWIKRDLLLVYILFLFNALHFYYNRKQFAFRFLFFFQLALCVFFSAGILLRLLENYELLKYGPFRLFPLLVPLLFFLHLAALYRTQGRTPQALIFLGLLSMLSMINPIGSLADQGRNTYKSWRLGPTDIERAYSWIATHTQNGTIVISPPWVHTGWYLSQRAQIVSYHYHPYTERVEWHNRLTALVGDNWEALIGTDVETKQHRFEQFYSSLSQKDISNIVSRYGGDYLISKAKYPYLIEARYGEYKVYTLNSHTELK